MVLCAGFWILSSRLMKAGFTFFQVIILHLMAQKIFAFLSRTAMRLLSFYISKRNKMQNANLQSRPQWNGFCFFCLPA
jgi:hypothetical protein